MFDADKIISLIRNEVPKGIDAVKIEGSAMADNIKNNEASKNATLSAAAIGALSAVLLSGIMGKFGKKLATYGSLATLGTIAYNAWKKHKNENDEVLFLPRNSKERATMGKITLKAIINAMKADGKIDDTERARLYNKLQKADLTDDEKAFFLEEIEKPIDTDGLIKAATSPEIASEIYAASFVAIKPDGKAEKAYLENLAKRLNLPQELANHIRAEALS